MRINNNIMALNTHRQFAINNNNAAKSTEKLSSGQRINRAGDDAAGLAISEKMRAQIRGLNMASKNSQDAISLVQTAEGALTETHAILQRMRELATQAASDTNDAGVDRPSLQAEFEQLTTEIDEIAGRTQFNNKPLLNGTFGTTTTITAGGVTVVAGVGDIKLEGFSAGNYTITFAEGSGDYTATFSDGTNSVEITGVPDISSGKINLDFGGGRKASITVGAGYTIGDLDTQVLTFEVTGTEAYIQTGANKDDKLAISIANMDAASLGIDGTVKIDNHANASTAIDTVNDAINRVSAERAKLGATQNRLQHKINNLDTSAENLQAAESRIRDLDMAKEMTTYTKNNILVQAATAMLAQANSAPQGVLQLLR